MVSIVALGLTGYIVSKYYSKSPKTSIKPGKVVIHTLPPTTNLVNPSPFGLKLQTFIRLAGNISCSLEYNQPFGSKGKSPWIEVDGHVVADTSFIIEFLNDYLKVTLDDHLTLEQKAVGRLIHKTMEENTLWAVIAFPRYLEELDYFLGTAKNFPWWKKLIIRWRVPRYIMKKMKGHGIGRHTVDEIQHIAREDLKAVSALLDDKLYLFGEKPSSYDATAFAILASIIYGYRENYWLNVYIRDKCPNLIDYTNRIRKKYWNDWDSLLA